MNEQEPRTSDASPSPTEGTAKAPLDSAARERPAALDVPLQDLPLKDPSLKDPSLKDPPLKDPPLKDPPLKDPPLKDPIEQTLARDAAWNPPTIVYAVRGHAGNTPLPSPSPRARAGAEDVTTRMPEKTQSPRPEIDERTVKMPERAPRPGEDDAPTVKAEPKAPRPQLASEREAEPPEPQGVKAAVRWLLERHGKKLWWLHTVYALCLGAFVVTFAQKGFDHARWLAISVSVLWLILLLFFRLFGTGARQDFATAWRGARLRFMVVTYVLKNLYQGMLFFLLPFYWKSASLDAPNRWFALLLGACALLSTLDLVFDRVLMRWKTLASMFYGVTLFACLNLVIPALFPHTRALWTLLFAAGISVLGFATLHLPLAALVSWAGTVFLVVTMASGVALAYTSRSIIPPVPMYLSSAGVGPTVLADGRLAMEVKSLDTSVIQKLVAVTDVVMPSGEGDRLHHVWRHHGEEVYRAPEAMSRLEGPEGTVRLKSQLAGRNLPPRLTGHWTVDVETEDGQLVGRTSFEVTE